MKGTRKTNPVLVALISDLKKAERETGSAIWRDIAVRLEKPSRNWAETNLSRLERYANEGETILVPGKVLAVTGDTIEVKFTRTGKTKKLLKGFAPLVKIEG